MAWLLRISSDGKPDLPSNALIRSLVDANSAAFSLTSLIFGWSLNSFNVSSSDPKAPSTASSAGRSDNCATAVSTLLVKPEIALQTSYGNSGPVYAVEIIGFFTYEECFGTVERSCRHPNTTHTAAAIKIGIITKPNSFIVLVSCVSRGPIPLK